MASERSNGEARAEGACDLRAFYKAQREALVRRYGVWGVREFGGRFHAHGHEGESRVRSGKVETYIPVDERALK